MLRIKTDKRPDWKEHAENVGFMLHTMYGEPYWNEGVHYEFSLRQIEDDIEDPSTELHAMCLEAVDEVLKSEYMMDNLDIPEQYRDYVANSWKTERNKSLYGRFDLVYTGSGPAKMIEYNADTPTSLWEAAVYQWMWLEEAKRYGIIDPNADQFNLIHESLVKTIGDKFYGKDMFFSSFGGCQEDYATVEYLGFCAVEAGVNPLHVNVEDISVNNRNNFCTKEGREIEQIFMLYPWEDMLRDDFASYLPRSKTQWVEPAWKSIVSNKGLLAVLWKMFPNHPNLLPTYFEHEAPQMGSYVRKPIFSREGSSVEMYNSDGSAIEIADDMGYMENKCIIQGYAEMPNFEGNFPVIGSWIVDETCVGMGIREDHSRITQDLSRFTPHTII